MHVFKYIFLLFTFFIVEECLGQDKQKKYPLGFIWNLGTSSYVGDLTTDVQSLTFPPHFGFGIVFHQLTPNISVAAEVNYFMLSAKKYINTKNYLGFRSHNNEISAKVLYEFKRNKKQFSARNDNSFYVFTGFALTSFQAKIQKSGDVPEFKSINQNPFSGTTPAIPVGLGMKFKTSSSVDIYLELGFRKTFSDYLDNVTPFKNNPNDAIAATNTSNVNVPDDDPKEGSKDSYFFSSLKVVYTPKYIFRKKPKSATATTTAAAKRNKKTSLKIKRSRKLENHEKVGLGNAPN